MQSDNEWENVRPVTLQIGIKSNENAFILVVEQN